MFISIQVCLSISVCLCLSTHAPFSQLQLVWSSEWLVCLPGCFGSSLWIGCLNLSLKVVLYCIVFNPFYSASFSMSHSEALQFFLVLSIGGRWNKITCFKEWTTLLVFR